MSRFFEALKQANASLSEPNEVGLETLVTNRYVNKIQDIAVGVDSQIAEVNGSEPTDPEARVTDPWVISEEHEPRQRRALSQNAVLTAFARTSVGKNVRIIPNAVDKAVVEHYRRLRTKVMQQHAIKPFRRLLVTSAVPQEGKSLTVLNLGLSFAMLPSFKILIIDGDMRRGTVGTWLGGAERPGLSNLLEGSASIREVMFASEDSSIHFIPAGTSKTPSTELLHTSEVSRCLNDLSEQFDLILVDSPPVTLVADAQLLAAHCDSVLLIARAFKTARKGLEKAANDLLPFRVIGTVLNGGTPAHLYSGYGGYY